MTTSRIVVFRLSSFGDVVLATAALTPIKRKFPHSYLIFVTSKNFESLIRGHPCVDEVLVFDRSKGIRGWLKLLHSLWNSDVNRVYDLHNSTRTKIARFYFAWKSLFSIKRYFWTSVSKQRIRHVCYYLFKKALPKSLRPDPWFRRFIERVDSSDQKSDLDLSYLLEKGSDLGVPNRIVLESKNYICVMPSSRWEFKEWAVDKWVKLLSRYTCDVVILGQRSDSSSFELWNSLNQEFKSTRRIYFWPEGLDFSDWAKILKGARMYLGVDTGFFHLAEGLNVRSLVVFGPTESGLGYGPRLLTTQIAQKDLFCRPCSKTGQVCFRVWDSRACLRKLEVDDVGRLISLS